MVGRFGLFWICLAVCGACSGAELFPNAVRRAAFFRAMEKEDANYDPAAKMLRSSFSSPGYHTSLQDGEVHRTRESLKYAVALLDSGQPDRIARAQDILRKVISLQDQDPESPTYGIWPWFMEEPLKEMSPPDWNWADFCGTQLLQVAIDHSTDIPMDLRDQVRDAILHAAASIKRRDVGPAYTNIALMGTYVTLVAGERFSHPELFTYGKKRLERFMQHAAKKGMFSEYNSPTYTVVAIEEISRMYRDVQDNASHERIRELNHAAWRHLARHFHKPTKQWAGPHSRSYATLLRPSVLAFIQRGTKGKVKFVSEAQAYESIDAQRIPLICDADFIDYFRKLPKAHKEVETFIQNGRTEHDIIGTTYMHTDFTLGSVNIGDLWNQRRPLVAYWTTPSGVAAVRLRCLHDGYDYASASLFTVQEEGDVLGGVAFVTDRGDTHISLDKIKDASIEAEDLRIRLEFEGAISDLQLPEKVELDKAIHFSCGSIAGTFYCADAIFGDYPISMETGRDETTAWVDIVLYKGASRELDFQEITEATVVFTLSIAPARRPPLKITPGVSMSIAYGIVPDTQLAISRKTWLWRRLNKSTMSLTMPLTPLATKEQSKAAAASRISSNPWKRSL